MHQADLWLGRPSTEHQFPTKHQPYDKPDPTQTPRKHTTMPSSPPLIYWSQQRCMFILICLSFLRVIILQTRGDRLALQARLPKRRANGTNVMEWAILKAFFKPTCEHVFWNLSVLILLLREIRFCSSHWNPRNNVERLSMGFFCIPSGNFGAGFYAEMSQVSLRRC